MALIAPPPSTPSFDLTGRTALLTGANGAIGGAIARAFAESGAGLVALVESGSDAERWAEDWAGSDDVHQLVPMDLRVREGRVGALAALVEEREVDIVVNAAGRISRGASEQFHDNDWYDVIEVNLHAAFDVARTAGRAMIARGRGGKIINIASLLSFQGGLNAPSYTASKHALAGLTRALANEWAPHRINVNAIAPGYVDTPLASALHDDPNRFDAITARIPAGRWARAEDISGAAIFLASSAADYVHGHVLVVDGGWLAR